MMESMIKSLKDVGQKKEVDADEKKRKKEREAWEKERETERVNAEKKIADDIKRNSGTLTDARDGKTYRTIKIGNQVWMAENLNYELKNSRQAWAAQEGITEDSKVFYCSEIKSANCSKFGRLYTWSAAMDSVGKFSENGKGCGMASDSKRICSPEEPIRGICPEGWHLPSKEEFVILEHFVAKSSKSIEEIELGPSTSLRSTSDWGGSWKKRNRQLWFFCFSDLR